MACRIIRSSALLCGSILVSCSCLFSQPGQSGLTFLKLGVGGRALGMGEAYTAVAGDPSAMYYNPAGIAFNQSSSLMLMHKAWIQGVSTEYISAQTKISHLGFGVSVNATSVDDIQLREIPGPPIGTFSAKNAAIGLSAAYAIDSAWSLGLTGKFLYEKILIDEASGFGLDLGSVYRTPWDISVGFSLSNLGSVNELQEQSSTLPTIYRGGVAYSRSVPSLTGDILVAGDIVVFAKDNTTHFHFGGEYIYNQTFAIRAGYQTGYEARSVTTGVGIHYDVLQIDYAFIPTQYDLGTTHTFSLSVQF